MFLGYGCCAEGYGEDYDTGADEKHNGKVEVVDATEETWAGRGLDAAASAKGELWDDAG